MVECRFVRGPAALLAVEPESLRTDAKLEVGHPTCADVDDPSQSTGEQAHQQHAHPA